MKIEKAYETLRYAGLRKTYDLNYGKSKLSKPNSKDKRLEGLNRVTREAPDAQQVETKAEKQKRQKIGVGDLQQRRSEMTLDAQILDGLKQKPRKLDEKPQENGVGQLQKLNERVLEVENAHVQLRNEKKFLLADRDQLLKDCTKWRQECKDLREALKVVSQDKEGKAGPAATERERRLMAELAESRNLCEEMRTLLVAVSNAWSSEKEAIKAEADERTRVWREKWEGAQGGRDEKAVKLEEKI